MAEIEDDDDLDDLFNYDIDDIQTTYNNGADADAAADTENASKATTNKGKGKDDGDLGVDEEIQIRKRKPTVKLTEERLLGPDGIPYLQANAAKKLKFKGKGHEISDLGRLLKFYQIWADNLYPKAQFKDAIDMIEKLGSSRGMHLRREEWIDEYKMKEREEDNRLIGNARRVLNVGENEIIVRASSGDIETPAAQGSGASGNQDNAEISREQANKDAGDSLFFQDDDDDLDDLDAIMLEAEKQRAPQTKQPTSASKTPGDVGDDEMDELDAIMREMEGNAVSKPATSLTTKKKPPIVADSDDDFEDAMAAMRENEK